MKKFSLLMSVAVLVVLLSVTGAWAAARSITGAGAISFQEFPKKIDGVDFGSIEELFSKAGHQQSKKDPSQLENGDAEAQYKLGVFFHNLLEAAVNGKLSHFDELGKSLAVSSSYEQMMYWLKRACTSTIPSGLYVLLGNVPDGRNARY